MTTTSRPSPRRRAPFAIALAAAGAIALTSCGLRLDTGPEGPSPASVAETHRQDAAIQAQNLAETTRAVAETETDPSVLEALDAVAAGLDEQVEALGGVWVAWPDGAPEGESNRPVPEPASASGLEDLRGLLTSSADEVVTVLTDVPATDQDLASVLTSVAVGRHLAAAELPREDGAEAAVEPAAPGADLIAGVADGPTVRALDQAHYFAQTIAAREDDAEAAERATNLQVLIDAALAAGAPDTREPAYPWPDGEAVTYRIEAEQDLLDQWIFLATTAPGQYRADLVDAAVDSALTLASLGEDPGALPGLPGSAPDAESASGETVTGETATG